MMFISVLLPAPFWPTSPRMRPRPSVEVDVADGVDAGEGLADALELEDRVAHADASPRAGGACAPRRARRRARMMPPFTTSM